MRSSPLCSAIIGARCDCATARGETDYSGDLSIVAMHVPVANDNSRRIHERGS
jgi:hypothetical protein